MKDKVRPYLGELTTTAIGVALALAGGLWWFYSDGGQDLGHGWSEMANTIGLNWQFVVTAVVIIMAVVGLKWLLGLVRKNLHRNNEWITAVVVVGAICVGLALSPFIGSMAGFVGVTFIGLAKMLGFVLSIALLTAIAFSIRMGAVKLLQIVKK